MRTALALLLSLVIAFCGLLGWTNAQLQQQACDVTVTATTLAGDPAAAAGIQVTSYAHYRHHLFWSATYPADNPQAIRTGYGFSQARWYETDLASSGYMSVSLLRSGWSSTTSLEDWIPASLLQMLKKIQADIPSVVDEENETVVDLSRYTDHFPLEVSIGPTSSLFLEITEEQLLEVLESYFFIPVPEGTRATVRLEELENGMLSGYSLRLNGDLSINSQSIIREDAVFFTLVPEGSESVHLDTSYIPGGLGVYRLSGNSLEDLSLTTLYSLPNGGRPLSLLKGRRVTTVSICSPRRRIPSTIPSWTARAGSRGSACPSSPGSRTGTSAPYCGGKTAWPFSAKPGPSPCWSPTDRAAGRWTSPETSPPSTTCPATRIPGIAPCCTTATGWRWLTSISPPGIRIPTITCRCMTGTGWPIWGSIAPACPVRSPRSTMTPLSCALLVGNSLLTKLPGSAKMTLIKS